MAIPKPFPHADFLRDLEHHGTTTCAVTATTLSAPWADALTTQTSKSTSVDAELIELLKAHRSVLQAAADTGMVADMLRRYQKFARPGQPSLHIVQLRQQQAAARQASCQSKQAFINAAAAFVRASGIHVPPRVGLERYVTVWIDANIPKDSAREETSLPV